ncbi:MAG: hypothetical protein AMXMBFR84_51000 [Candidatus Hydrogenedentota bacterium]
MNTSPNEFILLSALPAQRGPGGGLVLTQKYLNGVSEYAKRWPGKVSTLVRVNEERSSDMDHVEIMPGDLPFGLEERPDTDHALAARLRDAAVVLAFLCPEEAPTASLCKQLGVPIVYVSEYSLKTEKQIIDAGVLNPLRRWKRKWSATRGERIRLQALGIAAGIQCSGTPTYEVYRHVNPNALLFFDNRVRLDDVIDDAALAGRAQTLLDDRPLRLVFGGRLIPMKGAHHLPLVARELAQRGVRFQFDIFGSGALETSMRTDIESFGLSKCVRMRGVLDFEKEWVPMLKTNVDLFVCCHPQGDPSSMYPEVMACGVPIAGYDNDAFKGIVEHSGSGWLTPINEPVKLADVIAQLDACRKDIQSASFKARDFAAKHALENTFTARTHHLIRLSRKPSE